MEERKGKQWLSRVDKKISEEGLKWQAWKHSIVVVGNKKDIMPVQTRWEDEKVRVWLKHYCEGLFYFIILLIIIIIFFFFLVH